MYSPIQQKFYLAYMYKIRRIGSRAELSSFESVFADVLCRTFHNDAYYGYIMPNAKKSMVQLHWWMRILLRYTLKFGDIYYTDDHKAIALWLGPEKPMVNDAKILSMGLIRYPFKVGIRNFLRMIDISEQWGKGHKLMDKRHYYLMIIGVDPEFQRQGIGSRLMKVGLDKADKEGLDCFLETVTPEYVKFYEKHNFEIMSNSSFAENSQFWLMKRPSK